MSNLRDQKEADRLIKLNSDSLKEAFKQYPETKKIGISFRAGESIFITYDGITATYLSRMPEIEGNNNWIESIEKIEINGESQK